MIENQRSRSTPRPGDLPCSNSMSRSKATMPWQKPDFATLFARPLTQWGMRGDPPLWRAMARAVKGRPSSRMNSGTCAARSRASSSTSRGARCTDSAEPFLVPKFVIGSGMSDGMVLPVFWVRTAIPDPHRPVGDAARRAFARTGDARPRLADRSRRGVATLRRCRPGARRVDSAPSGMQFDGRRGRSRCLKAQPGSSRRSRSPEADYPEIMRDRGVRRGGRHLPGERLRRAGACSVTTPIRNRACARTNGRRSAARCSTSWKSAK